MKKTLALFSLCLGLLAPQSGYSQGMMQQDQSNYSQELDGQNFAANQGYQGGSDFQGQDGIGYQGQMGRLGDRLADRLADRAGGFQGQMGGDGYAFQGQDGVGGYQAQAGGVIDAGVVKYGDQPGGDANVCCPPDQRMNDCYCCYCRYKPCYYNTYRCVCCPVNCTKKCCRMCPQYYEKCCCRYVPQYYSQTCCRMCPQYYCVNYSVNTYKRVCDRCCKFVPCYYWKRECQPTCCPQPAQACCPTGGCGAQ